MRSCTRTTFGSRHAFVGVLLVALVGCATAMPPSMPHSSLGFPAPRFDAQSLDDRYVSVPSAGGSARVTVVDFWASWCGGCRTTMPALERLYRDRLRDGVAVIGISVDDHAEQALSGAYQFGVTFPIVHDPHQELQAAYGVSQIPTTFVLDQAGRVRFVGRDPESIKRAVNALMSN